MRKDVFVIQVEFVSKDGTAAELTEHIKTAIKQWGAGGDPSDVMWPDNLKVTVKRIPFGTNRVIVHTKPFRVEKR